MNLQQIEAVCAIARRGLSVSIAAETLGKSQSGLSRQLKLLEREIGTPIFHRTRNKLVGLTPAGEKIVNVMQRIADELKLVYQLASEEAEDAPGELRVATTHAHALYVLPLAFQALRKRFPNLSPSLQQVDPVQCHEYIRRGDADIGVITVSDLPPNGVVTIPAYKLPRCVIVPAHHPLTKVRNVTLQHLARYSMISYPVASANRTVVTERFSAAGLHPQIVCTATDSDVCKAYARLGMGIVIMARAAYDPAVDKGLVAIDAAHLFPPAVVHVVMKKKAYLSRGMRAFVSILAPHIGEELLERAVNGEPLNQNELLKAAPVYEYGKRIPRGA
jgi:LysR family transcriptional regulator, cys regulon transcriptional activator